LTIIILIDRIILMSKEVIIREGGGGRSGSAWHFEVTPPFIGPIQLPSDRVKPMSPKEIAEARVERFEGAVEAARNPDHHDPGGAQDRVDKLVGEVAYRAVVERGYDGPMLTADDAIAHLKSLVPASD
jgi:hypothetical protein